MVTSITFPMLITNQYFLMFTSNNQLHTEQSSNCTMHVVTKQLLAGISLLSADYQQLLAGIGILLLSADTDN